MTLAILLFVFLSLFLTKNIRINSLSFAFLLYAFSIYLLELNLIKIKQLSFYTKLFMFACYFMLIIGAFIGSNFKHKTLMLSKINLTLEKKIFLYSITISLISILLNTFYMIKSTSGFLEFFIRYNELYGKRIAGTHSILIPYLNSLIYISASAGGAILANGKKESKTIYGILPVLLIIVDSIINFGRANMLIGVIIFATSYFSSAYRNNNYKLRFRLNSFLKLSTLFILLILMMVQIRKFRGGFENYSYNDNVIIEKLVDWGLFTPSFVLYFAGAPAVLNQTFGSSLLESDDVILENTFAPISRIYAPVFDKEVKRYEEFVNIGPRYSNTGTMLKDFLLDFGIFGTLIFTLFLGMLYGISYRYYLRTGNIHLYSFLSAYIVMGAFVNLFRSGQFLLPFLIVLLTIISQKFRWRQR